MTQSQKTRRPGYAPANPTVGRRGLHTRDLIVQRAGQLFVAKGYHSTSIDAIAKAVGGSRATIYQYFESKDDIFRELVHQCEPAVMDHAHRLGELGPDANGVASLHVWLGDWAQLYDKYAMVFLEFPGIGAIKGLPQTDAGVVSGQYADLITDKLRHAGVRDIDAADAAAALLRISHMVNLYRFRGMFGLTSSTHTTNSLTIALQLLLFPETPASAIQHAIPTPISDQNNERATTFPVMPVAPPEPDVDSMSPIRNDILVASSALINERGYYGVAMEDIAAAADVSRATLYRHFGTKLAILDELSEQAVLEGTRLAADLYEQAQHCLDFDALHSWLARYVRFHRNYSGAMRAWYDGTLADQLPTEGVSHGIGAFHVAVAALLRHVDPPAGMDTTVAAAVFVAVLGRLTELSLSRRQLDNDYEAARLMLLVLKRALLGQ
ncbi:TetR/AcrR family transcriptional regulator [Mycobacterium sp. E2497]|uniref:TetR/AcrR family transcriptional regulator n=1 Tax=Mycobacterium sp. E2497 TaxID=1834135 RepID=UPI0009EDA1CF|nr:TetR/AcrR family transcriptional regulator [Mycobacterium sp. E2497]